MSFCLSLRHEQLNAAQKLGIFKFLFLLHFVIIFSSLSSGPLPARPLFLIFLRNGVKKHTCEKGVICDVYRNGQFITNFLFQWNLYFRHVFKHKKDMLPLTWRKIFGWNLFLKKKNILHYVLVSQVLLLKKGCSIKLLIIRYQRKKYYNKKVDESIKKRK